MKKARSESYSVLKMPEFLLIGGNISSHGGVVLFDNFDDQPGEAVSQMPFGNKPLKLQSYVLLICKAGELEFRLDCNNPLKLSGGDMVFFRHGQIVEFISSSDDAKVMFMAFSHEILMSLGRFMPHEDAGQYTRLTKTPALIDDIYTHYRMMRATISDTESVFRENVLVSYVYIVLMKLLIAFNNRKDRRDHDSSRQSRQHELYHRFVALVKDNFMTHRDVSYYASSLFISSGHLSRIIKSASGKTVGAWIKDYVILEAKVMLQSSDLTISQISDYLNFPNASFFSKYFRENTGMTPGQYRRS